MVESVFVTAAVAGVVEFLKLLKDNNWTGAATIVVAALIGGLAGWAKIDSLTITGGIIAGLAASGAYTVVNLVGKPS
jgi:hypothetical protein